MRSAFNKDPVQELWGVSSGPKPNRKRGPVASTRRAAKRKAKRMGVRLKWYLRTDEARIWKATATCAEIGTPV